MLRSLSVMGCLGCAYQQGLATSMVQPPKFLRAARYLTVRRSKHCARQLIRKFCPNRRRALIFLVTNLFPHAACVCATRVCLASHFLLVFFWVGWVWLAPLEHLNMLSLHLRSLLLKWKFCTNKTQWEIYETYALVLGACLGIGRLRISNGCSKCEAG